MKPSADEQDSDRFADPGFLERLRDRDPEATEAVVTAYLPQILRAARGAGFDASQAEDVAQATFLTFLEVVRRFEGRSRVRTFLFGILYKKVAEARRGLGRDRRTEDIDEVLESRFDPDGGWSSPPRPIDLRIHDAEVRQRIEECLDTIPMSQRMAFMLREVEHLETDEMCQILDVSRTNLYVLLYRARNALRKCLETRPDGTHHGKGEDRG